MGHKRTWATAIWMSTFNGKADVDPRTRGVGGEETRDISAPPTETIYAGLPDLSRPPGNAEVASP